MQSPKAILRTLWRAFKADAKDPNHDSTARIQPGASVENFRLGRCATIYPDCILANGSLGNFSYVAGPGTMILHTEIGKFCSIAPGVKIGLGSHPSHTFVSTHPAFFSTLKQAQVQFVDKNYFHELLPVRVGNDVWIGAGAVVLNGVSIGDGAIVGAGAVVTKNVPPYAVVVGVPAKVLKFRFTADQISRLLSLRWWDRDETWIRKHWKSFQDVEVFLSLNTPDRGELSPSAFA